SICTPTTKSERLNAGSKSSQLCTKSLWHLYASPFLYGISKCSKRFCYSCDGSSSKTRQSIEKTTKSSFTHSSTHSGETSSNFIPRHFSKFLKRISKITKTLNSKKN